MRWEWDGLSPSLALSLSLEAYWVEPAEALETHVPRYLHLAVHQSEVPRTVLGTSQYQGAIGRLESVQIRLRGWKRTSAIWASLTTSPGAAGYGAVPLVGIRMRLLDEFVAVHAVGGV